MQYVRLMYMIAVSSTMFPVIATVVVVSLKLGILTKQPLDLLAK